MDWNVGYVGSADYLNMLGTIDGSSNTFDIDIGYDASAEYLNWDLDLDGSSNVFTTKIDSDNAVWNWTVNGSSNDINTNQSDASDNKITAVLTGSTMTSTSFRRVVQMLVVQVVHCVVVLLMCLS